MKRFLFALLFFAMPTLSCAPTVPELHVDDTQDVVTKMDALIVATEISVKRQKALRDLLVQYKEMEKKAIQNPDDSDTLLQLVLLAKQVQESINTNYLQDYFPKQFLDELNKLSAIALKKNIPAAK